jgi:hypothetical protein
MKKIFIKLKLCWKNNCNNSVDYTVVDNMHKKADEIKYKSGVSMLMV